MPTAAPSVNARSWQVPGPARSHSYAPSCTSGRRGRTGVVTEAEFREFVDHHVTPRFPHGLTLLKGDGQFPGEDAIIKEQSFVLILLYPYDTRDEGSRHVERIRTLYQEEFEQRSVLRVDHSFIVWVSF
jgi:hypothetical protein